MNILCDDPKILSDLQQQLDESKLGLILATFMVDEDREYSLSGDIEKLNIAEIDTLTYEYSQGGNWVVTFNDHPDTWSIYIDLIII